MKPDFCKDRADWLVDAVACSTQDRMFLRGDEKADQVAIDAVYLNGLKALRAAYAAGLERAAEIADKSGIMFADDVADAIRAEKEADHD